MRTSARLLVACAVAIAAGVSFGAAIRPVLHPKAAREVATGSEVFTAPTEVSNQARQEWQLYYIGMENCAWSTSPQLPSLLEEVRKAIERRARGVGGSFTFIGVAVDRSPERGLRHLRRFSGFDEVHSGKSWANRAVNALVDGELAGPAGTPQLVLLRRVRDQAQVTSYGLVQESAWRYELLARKLGLQELYDWKVTAFTVPYDEMRARD